jgi:hypothetical protein
MGPLAIKTIGYLISSVSVGLLGLASWHGLEDEPGLRACLIAGMAASVAGMLLRWCSYWKEHVEEAGKAPTPATTTAGEWSGSAPSARPASGPPWRG